MGCGKRKKSWRYAPATQIVIPLSYATLHPELEALLVLTGVVIPPDRPQPKKPDEDDELLESDEDEPRSSMAKSNVRAPKNIRGPARDDDDDSDFDLWK